MDAETAKATTLAALTRWSATPRDQLVAAAWNAGNRNITELARAAGRNRQAIYEDLKRHGITPTTDREEPPTMPANTTEIPAPGWRHPALLAVTRKPTSWGSGDFTYVIAPFTGAEPAPEIPAPWRGRAQDEPDYTLSDTRAMETAWVTRAWADARFLRLFKALNDRNTSDNKILEDALTADNQTNPRWWHHPLQWSDHSTAGEVWTAYTTARDALTAAYEAMKTQPDNMWRAGLGRIVDATEPAEQAAQRWDDLAPDFWKIATWYDGTFDAMSSPGPYRALEQVAEKAGIDTEGWLIFSPDEYRSNYSRTEATAGGRVAGIIEKGQAWLSSVSDLADR